MARFVGRLVVTVLTIGAAGVLAGCGGHGAPAGAAATTSAGPAATSAAASATAGAAGGGVGAAPATSAARPPVAALTCAQLRSAAVGSTTVSYNGYHDSIPLGDGHWSGEDGNTVDLQHPCGIGDLNGDGAADALGVVALTSGGTGTFFTLVAWRNAGGHPVCVAVADLGDRNPVRSVSIAGGRATVVYLTRTDDAPAAQVNLRRTAVYRLTGATLVETGHTDEPYTE